MDIGIAALSEVRRLDSGEIMAGGYTYNWSIGYMVTMLKVVTTLMVTMPKELL